MSRFIKIKAKRNEFHVFRIKDVLRVRDYDSDWIRAEIHLKNGDVLNTSLNASDVMDILNGSLDINIEKPTPPKNIIG